MGGLRELCPEWDRTGENFVKFWSVGVDGSFRELGTGFTEGVWASGTPWPGSRGYETGTDGADVERAVCQPLLWNLAVKLKSVWM